jgi:hypothetical protein
MFAVEATLALPQEDPGFPQVGPCPGSDSRHYGSSWDGADIVVCTMTLARISSRLPESKEGSSVDEITRHSWIGTRVVLFD